MLIGTPNHTHSVVNSILLKYVKQIHMLASLCVYMYKSSATAKIARVGCHDAVQGHSSSLILVPIKSPCDFLSAKLTFYLSHFQVIANYWSNFRFRQGAPLFSTLVRGEALNSGPQNLASRNYKHRCDVWCKMHFDTLNRLGVAQECDRRTDRQTEPLLVIAPSNNPR